MMIVAVVVSVLVIAVAVLGAVVLALARGSFPAADAVEQEPQRPGQRAILPVPDQRRSDSDSP